MGASPDSPERAAVEERDIRPEELAELARAGDIAALDHLTRACAQRLFALARAACRDEQLAQDAFQDGLTNAVAHLDQWRGEGPLGSWVGRMIVNACHRMRRGRKNDPTLHVTGIDLPGGENPEAAAARHELGAAIDRAMDALKPIDRTLIWLVDVEGWNAAEAARRTGLSHAAARSRLSRSRRRLREALGAAHPYLAA